MESPNIDALIALPLEECCSSLDPPPDWKNMPVTKFMEKYGNDVREKYDLPTEAELKVLYDEEDQEDLESTGEMME